MLSPAWTNYTTIFGFDASELASIGVEFGMTVQPQRRLLHGAVECKRSSPHICIACVGKIGLWQHKDAVSLLYESAVAADTSACNRTSISNVVNLGILVGALAGSCSLYPCGNVECQHLGLSTSLDGDIAVLSFTNDDMLSVMGSPNSRTIGHIHTPCHCQWRRGYSNTFHLA